VPLADIVREFSLSCGVAFSSRTAARIDRAGSPRLSGVGRSCAAMARTAESGRQQVIWGLPHPI